MPNHLIYETSPYLTQHAENPVDWYPWNEEALHKARDLDRPIFLSIGYAACHWCHVMAHESFEDPHIADFLNRNFVSIKVDREEHPELDNIYMSAVVAMTGQGGWPMSVFLTPDLRPFYAGTYFPPAPRYGMPAFQQVLMGVRDAWVHQRDQVLSSAAQISEAIRSDGSQDRITQGGIETGLLSGAVEVLAQNYDWQNGGWGRAPKFPQPMLIEFFLSQAAQGNETAGKMARHTLDAMAQGGMYDFVSGGFHRYSTDARWLVPHYEKMLYDNALLARAYLHAYQLTQDGFYRYICTSTLDFLLREMANSQGGFYSSLDADSGGEEGGFYLWNPQDLPEVLEPELAQAFVAAFSLEEAAEAGGKSLLRFKDTPNDPAILASLSAPDGKLHIALDKLRASRDLRPRPASDRKVVVSWNALALQSLAEAGRFLGRADYLQTAQANADFLLDNLYADSRLKRTWLDGYAHIDGFLEDYAGLALSLLALYQADFDPKWYRAARRLLGTIRSEFPNPEGGFFDTGLNRQDLLLKPAYLEDNATPSGNSLAALCLLWFSAFDEDEPLRELAEKSIRRIQPKMLTYPPAYALWLQAIDFWSKPVQQVALVWPAAQESEISAWRSLLDRVYVPGRIVAGSALPLPEGQPGLLSDRPALQGRVTAYLCRDFVCRQPVTDLGSFAVQLA